MSKWPIVSIICTAYNQEAFIEDALKGFVMQKTTFPFEIIVHDDASTDRTVEIIKSYEMKYPELFCNIYQETNQYSKRNGEVGKIVYAAAKGKYIALCEGDDYWIDPLKLQKQVDFLEENPEFGMVHSAYLLKDEYEQTFKKIQIDIDHNDENIIWKIIGQELFICTSSILSRAELHKNIIIDFANDFSIVPIGDTQTWFHLARLSRIGYINESLSVYRKSTFGVTGSGNIKKRIYFLENALKLDLYLANTYKAPDKWKEKIKYEFSRSLLIIALLDKDSFRIKKYSEEIFKEKNWQLSLLKMFSYLPFFKQQFIYKLLGLFKK